MPTSPTSGPGGGSGASAPLALTGTLPATVPLTVKGAAGQSTDIFSVLANDGTQYMAIASDGRADVLTGNGINAAGATVRPNGTVRLFAGTSLADSDYIIVSSADNIYVGLASGMELQVSANAGANLFRVLDSGGVVFKANAAPADGSLAAGECALWLDATPGVGNTKLMVKAKDSGGTVRAGAIVLA